MIKYYRGTGENKLFPITDRYFEINNYLYNADHENQNFFPAALQVKDFLQEIPPFDITNTPFCLNLLRQVDEDLEAIKEINTRLS